MTTATQRQLRKGTTSQIAAKTPASGELWADTSIPGRLVVGDGSSVGGNPIPYLVGGILNGHTAVKFPASNVPSSDVNTLDDYEEVSFTPTIKIAGAVPTGLTYSTQVGAATKIGNRVLFSAHITLSAKGSSAGTVTVEGLPFGSATTANLLHAASVHFTAMGSSVNCMTAFVKNFATNIGLARIASGTATLLADTDLTNTSDFFISGSYQAA